jgi:hypothetical protein
MMANKSWIGLIFLLVTYVPAFAFNSVNEQIDAYLEILATGSIEDQIQMLERLQWSGLSDPRLYDEVERQLLEKYLSPDLDKYAINLLAHKARALGYSGDDGYRISLGQVQNETVHRKLSKHAKKALNELGKYWNWNKLIAKSDISVEGKSAEVTNYMKMLGVDDVFVQRNAARAIYHERQQDSHLLALTAEKLQGMYMQQGLDKQAQDTAAWFCKALGQSGGPKYTALLSNVAASTPYKKIKKYASKYAQ